MYSNIAKAALVSWNLELQKMDMKLKICCKYYLSLDWLCIDIDIFAFIVSIGFINSWISWCACYYLYANVCSTLCRSCLLIYANTQRLKSLERKSGWPDPNLALASITPSFPQELPEGCKPVILHCQGLSNCPGVFLFLLFSPHVPWVVLLRMYWFSCLSVWQPMYVCWVWALSWEEQVQCLVGRWCCLTSGDPSKHWVVLPSGSDIHSVSVFYRRHNSYLACGVQFFCTFTSTSDMLWK